MFNDTFLRWPSLVGIALTSAIVWLGCTYAIGDDLATVLPLGIIAGIGSIYFFWQSVMRKQWALLAIMVAGPTLLSMTFRTRTIGDPTLDWQVAMKIVVWCLMVIVCIINASRLRLYLTDPVILAFACYCGLTVLSTVYSPVPLVTGMAAVAMTSYLAFACLLVNEIPKRKLILVLLWAFAIACVIHVIAGFVVPDIGYLQDSPDPFIRLHQPPVPVRLQGLTGQPNNLGRFASIYALLVFVVAYEGYLRPIIWLPNAIFAIGVVWLSQSRGTLFALFIGALALIPRRYLLPIVSLAASLTIVVLVSGQVDHLLALVGRDGTADETMDMAGRVDLWDFVLGLIRQRPFLGYGFNSFESYAERIWTGPAANGVASHNNYLSVLYSDGIVGMIPFASGFLILLYRWLVRSNAPRDFFVISTLICGYAEIDVMSAIAFVPSLIFFIIIASDTRDHITTWSLPVTEDHR